MYSVYITKNVNWFDSDGVTITPDLWKGLFHNGAVQYIDDFHVQLDNFVLIYTGKEIKSVGPDPVLEIPDQEWIDKMKSVAKELRAKIQGEELEIYADFTEIHSALKSDYRKIAKANLPEGFPIIDDIDFDEKVVTKMEILDLTNEQYADVSIIDRHIKQYLHTLRNFSRVISNGYDFTIEKEFFKRHLEIAIPQGMVTAAQKQKIRELQRYADERNMRLIVVEVE